MAVRNKGKKIYKTMQGKQIDLDLLIKRNELTPAVGNAKVNARGDELGPGGKIIKKREQVVQEYYANNRSVVDEPTKREEKIFQPPLEPISSLTETEIAQLEEFDADPVPAKTTSKTTKKEEWVEDKDGNFVKK